MSSCGESRAIYQIYPRSFQGIASRLDHLPKPHRTVLEIAQLVALLDAAGDLQARPRSTTRAKLTADQAAEIRRRLAAGETQAALRREFGIGAPRCRCGQDLPRRPPVGWRALCATLAYAGPPISEAFDLRERDVRLHDPAQSRLWIADSKTDRHPPCRGHPGAVRRAARPPCRQGPRLRRTYVSIMLLATNFDVRSSSARSGTPTPSSR